MNERNASCEAACRAGARHPDDRTCTVISGTWYVGYGDQLDPTKLKALPPGSYHTEPANVSHYSVIKEEGVVVQITGTGPTATRFLSLGNAPGRSLP
jgi:quercetin dioxygenase-like cupin family protein